jgi:hypothetical protein
MQTRTRTVLAWSLFLASFGCCAGGLVVALLLVRPLTAGVLVQGASEALVFRLSFATIGLVLTLRRPAIPIGWLYAAAGLVWSLEVSGPPWVGQLVAAHRPLPPMLSATGRSRATQSGQSWIGTASGRAGMRIDASHPVATA